MTFNKQSNFYEKVLDKEEIFNGKVFSVEKAKVELMDGSISSREMVFHHGGACILAIDADRNIYLVKQYRISVKQDLLEIPAGKLEKGEDHFSCAKRELYEELGMTAKNWSLLSEFFPTPGYCSERIKIYLARNLTIGENKLDPGEFLEVKKIHLTEALKMIKNKQIVDSKTMIAILLADQILSEDENIFEQ